MKKIAIIYSGENQKPLVQKVISMGYSMVVLTTSQSLTIPISCKCYNISSRGYWDVINICKSESIHGICSVASEWAVVPMAHICEALGLPGITVQLAKICTNKLSMKKLFSSIDILTPQYRVAFFADNKEDVLRKCTDIGFPVLVKPIDSCNSHGITLVKNESQLPMALHEVRKCTRKDRFLIERYIPGESFGVEVFVDRNKVRFILPVGNFNLQKSVDIPIGHYAPYYKLSDQDITNIERDVNQILIATGFQDGFYTIDCRYDTHGRIYFLEIGARCGGNMLPELMMEYYGFDVYRAIVSQSLGESVIVDKYVKQPCAAGYILDNCCEKSDRFVIRAESGLQAYCLGKNYEKICDCT